MTAPWRTRPFLSDELCVTCTRSAASAAIRQVVMWFEGPDFRHAVDSAEKVRSDEAYLACSLCLELIEGDDREGLAARELVRQRGKGGLKPGVTERDVVRLTRRLLEDTFWRARAE